MNAPRLMMLKYAALGLTALSCVGIGASAAAQDGQPTREPSIQSRLEGMFSYYLRDGGVWRQENKDFQEGEGLPVAYVKKYSWGPGNTIILDDTYALMEDGACPQQAHNVMNWDRKENKIHVQVFHHSGVWVRGYAGKSGEHETSAELSGVLPDGSEMKMRDTTDLSDPDRAVITAMFWDGENWNKGDTVSWIHVSADEKPCGFD